MARSGPQWINARSLLAGLTLGLCLCAVLPARWLSWAEKFSTPMRTIVVPITGPLTSILPTPGERSGNPLERDPAYRELLDQRESAVLEAVQLRQENDNLKQVIIDLQQGLALAPGMRVMQYPASVIGTSVDLGSKSMTVRAGTREGIEPNSVVVVRAVHLVGRVTQVSARMCTVLPITDSSAGLIGGIVINADHSDGPKCLLTPTGRGTLTGKVGESFDSAAGAVAEMKVGMTVRLQDNTWPASSQRLILGTIERVTNNDAGFPNVITVRPVHPIERPSEVTIRVLEQGAGGGTGGAGP